MSPTKAIALLIIIILIVVAGFALLLKGKTESGIGESGDKSGEQAEGVVGPEEPKNKIDEINEATRSRALNQEEIDFILNPPKTDIEQSGASAPAGEDLDGASSQDKTPASKSLSQDEINKILNPQ